MYLHYNRADLNNIRILPSAGILLCSAYANVAPHPIYAFDCFLCNERNRVTGIGFCCRQSRLEVSHVGLPLSQI